jgi:hypothetical protein
LIPHWIEHDNQHAVEFRRWSGKAVRAARDIQAAAEAIALANEALMRALDELGGPAEHQTSQFGRVAGETA